jgi:hypothetical protein
MSLRSRPTLKNRKSGGTDRRRRHRHSPEADTRLVPAARVEPSVRPLPDIEDYMYAAWGAFLADEVGARAGC